MDDDTTGKGRIADPFDARDYRAEDYLPRAAKVSTVNKTDLRKNLGPVLDQGPTPQCVTHSGAAVKCLEERRDHRRTYRFDPGIAYAKCKTRDGYPGQDGTTARALLDVLYKEGYGRLGKNWDEDAAKFKIGGYARIRTIAEIEQALIIKRPVLLGMDWYRSWNRPVGHRLVMPNLAIERAAGGHEIVICGHNSKMKEFIIRNSWGEDWADGGHAVLPYDVLEWQLTLAQWPADIWFCFDAEG